MGNSMPPRQAKHTLFTLVCHYRSNNCLTHLTQNAKFPQKNLANIYLTHTDETGRTLTG